MDSPVILVVGAGPTGLVTALTLAVNGVRCRIIDRRAGSVLMRGTMELATIAWIPPDAPYPHTYIFPQPVLEDVLRQKLVQLGVAVEWNAEFVGLEDPSVAILAGGQRIAATWIIGCDGAHSRVRAAARIAFEGRSTGEVHFLADAVFRPENPVPGPAMWLRRTGH